LIQRRIDLANAIDKTKASWVDAVQQYEDLRQLVAVFDSEYLQPMSSLRSALDALASSFANGVLAAIRGASIDDLHAESGGGRRQTRGGATTAGNPGPRARKTRSGRLARRGEAEIGKAVDQVISLLKKSKTGLRSEQIKKALGLDVREVPRILKTGLASKKLAKKGQKRATVYTAR